jgi:hypothetical protein
MQSIGLTTYTAASTVQTQPTISSSTHRNLLLGKESKVKNVITSTDPQITMVFMIDATETSWL